MKELKKVGGKALIQKEEFEWLGLFEENKIKALDLITQIDMTEKNLMQWFMRCMG